MVPNQQRTMRSSFRWPSARSRLYLPKQKAKPMRFDTPATNNAIDQLKIVGKPTDRIDGPMKTTGRAPYAYERHDVVPNQAYGFILGSAIAKGRINAIDLA